MEVATSLLYLDASLEDDDFDHPAGRQRVQRLAQRIRQVREGRGARPLEPWMEELYRRVSDRQTMGSVVQELRASLSEIEKHIDQFFRNPAQREVLIPVPASCRRCAACCRCSAMDQASHAVVRMRDDVDALVATDVDPQRAAEAGTFERLADNLGALSFLIDMLSVQPQMAKSLFRFDPSTGNLSAVMGRRRTGRRRSAASTSCRRPPPLVDQAQSLALAAAGPMSPTRRCNWSLQRLSQQALLADQRGWPRPWPSAQARCSAPPTTRSARRCVAELAQAVAESGRPEPARTAVQQPVRSRPRRGRRCTADRPRRRRRDARDLPRGSARGDARCA